MLLSCYYPSRITSSSTKDIIYLQQDGPFSEVKSIQDVESKYVYFEIKTAYSHESYFALPKYESLEHCADVFLSEICFCDAYEITLARYATMKECNDIDEFMKLEKVPKGYWDAGEEMSLLTARNCYFQEQENNLKRGKSR